MKPNYEQQARELAERCADAISNFRSEPFASNPYFATVHSEAKAIILRELNLAKLLEDAAMLDWLTEDWERTFDLSMEQSPGEDVRTAIRNAMREDRR